MLNKFYAWLCKLGGVSVNATAQVIANEKNSYQNSCPYTGPERRRQEPHGVSAGDRWENNQQLKDCLLAAAGEQMKGAKEKQENSYWGATGYIEATAVSDAIRTVEDIPMTLSLQDYRTEMERRFDRLIEAFRRDDNLDPDGYGLGTLYAILRSAGWSL